MTAVILWACQLPDGAHLMEEEPDLAKTMLMFISFIHTEIVVQGLIRN